MCGGSPSMPAPVAATPQPTIAAAKQADAKISKPAPSRNKDVGLAGRDVRTSPRGLNDMANTPKKQLLGE